MPRSRPSGHTTSEMATLTTRRQTWSILATKYHNFFYYLRRSSRGVTRRSRWRWYQLHLVLLFTTSNVRHDISNERPKTSNNHVEKQKKCAGGKEEKWKKLQNVKRRLRMRRCLLVSLMTMAWQFSDCQTIVSYRPKLDSTLVVVECTRGHWGDSSPTTKQSQTQVCGGQKGEGPESSLRCPERVSVLTPEFICVQSLCINSGQPTTLCLFVRESNSAVCPFVSLDNQLGWVELTISWGTSLNSTTSHSFTMGMARARGPTVTSAEEGVCQCAIVIMCQSQSINVPK